MIYTKEFIYNQLLREAETEYGAFSKSLLGKGTEERVVLGVRLPRLKKLAKEIRRAEGFQYLQEMQVTRNDSMEENMLYGFVICEMQEKLSDLIPFIQKYVSLIDNWSLCDSFCAGLKVTKKEPELMWELIQDYLQSDQEFELRYAVVMLMDYYVDEEHIEKLLAIFDRICHEGYYVKMAVAWALSKCLVYEWERTIQYLMNGNHLDAFTYRKTLQKGRESLRITNEQKEVLKELL